MNAEAATNPGSIPVPSVPSESRRAKMFGRISAQSIMRQLFHLVLLAVLAMGSYFVISHCVLQSVQVVGVSMVPTLHNADHYFLNRLAYYLHAPQHSDIVVAKDPTDGTFVVKRIVALPGEAIHFKNGEVYINGVKLKEPYLAYGTFTFTNTKVNEALILCGRDQYFLLGDNRGNSFDSRMYGPVRRQNILGAIMR
jgi:signal peptidase I